MRQYLVLTITITSLLLVCGSDSREEREIADTVEGFFRALGEDATETCSYLARGCTKEVSFGDFATQLQLSAFFAGNEVRVENVEIIERGEDEILANLDIILVTEGEDSPMAENGLGRARVVEESGRWRLADCENFLAPD